jgi:sodium-dependent dicarboxylate transporter 2/3/5
MNILHNNRILKILCSLFLFVALLNIPSNETFTPNIINVIAVSVFIFSLWITEALPIPVTSLFPIFMMPIFGIMDVGDITKHYGNKIIFLFLSGLILAIAISKWNLSKRIALYILKFTSKSVPGIMLGFMIATAFLSMWISNTATTMMMLPIAMSVIGVLQAQNDQLNSFAKYLLISIAYSASIGGMATIIGTPPNAILASYASESLNYEFEFIQWFKMFFPLVVILIILMWIYLRIFVGKIEGNLSKGQKFIDDEIKKLGKITYEEINVLIVFAIIACGWIFKSYLPFKIHDSSIGIMGITLLFILPDRKQKDTILNWEDAREISWGTLLLFGGGISIAKSLESSGIITILGDYISLWSDGNILLAIIIALFLTIFLTEFIGNAALIAIMIPILVEIGSNMSVIGAEHQFDLVLPAVIACSCAFMLPMSTPPNAIIFSSKIIKISEMARVGFLANIFAGLVILAYFRYFIH